MSIMTTEAIAPPIPLYVATDLSVITPEPPPTATDVTIDRRIYRRLDPLYYAWLRSRVTRARHARDAGKLTPPAYDRLHHQFMGLHEAAITLLGEHALRQGCAAFDPLSYRPPGWKPKPREPPQSKPPQSKPPAQPLYLYPPGGDYPFHVAITSATIAKVDTIRELALSLGWTLPSLYQNRGQFKFPLGHDYGLVCFVSGDESLGEVTSGSIEIRGISPRGSQPLKLYNPDAQHPWNGKG